MTMQECYKAIGGNYEAVLGRLHSEALIQRFTLKFLEDQSYLQLKQALENKNYEDAFRSAHTLKGVCQNLSFDRLLVNYTTVSKPFVTVQCPAVRCPPPAGFYASDCLFQYFHLNWF